MSGFQSNAVSPISALPSGGYKQQSFSKPGANFDRSLMPVRQMTRSASTSSRRGVEVAHQVIEGELVNIRSSNNNLFFRPENAKNFQTERLAMKASMVYQFHESIGTQSKNLYHVDLIA